MDIRVFTDLRFTSYSYPTGVGKHIANMVKGLTGTAGNDLSLLAARDQAGLSGSLSFLPIRTLPLPWKLAEATWVLTGRPWPTAGVGARIGFIVPRTISFRFGARGLR